jgi:hypothetical protein
MEGKCRRTRGERSDLTSDKQAIEDGCFCKSSAQVDNSNNNKKSRIYRATRFWGGGGEERGGQTGKAPKKGSRQRRGLAAQQAWRHGENNDPVVFRRRGQAGRFKLHAVDISICLA